MNKTFWVIGGLATAGLLFYFYNRNKKSSVNSNDTGTGATGTGGTGTGGTTTSVTTSTDKNYGVNEQRGLGALLSGVVDNVVGTGKSNDNLDNPQFDTRTKGYKKMNDALTKWKLFMRDYRKDGLFLRDSNSNGLLGKEATESAYVFATKEIASIERGITKDNSLSQTQKVLLLDKIKSYYNDFLPLFFDKSRYTMNADWYKSAISKMTLVDYYK